MTQNISFEDWLMSAAPASAPEGVVAYNFELTENYDWSVQLIGASTYDESDPDWACPPVAWNTDVSEFTFSRENIPTWEEALDYVVLRVTAFLEEHASSHASSLRKAKAVCAGFVDGDLTVVWRHNP